MMSICRGLALLSLLLSVSAAGADKVRLQLKWEHQFQFAGYYAAQEQGYYRNAGLEVEILPARPGEDPVRQVIEGKAEFGVGSTELLLLREQGVPLVVLAVIFQHSPLALMALKHGGIQTIHDLAGQKVMIEPGSAELHAYLRREGISADNFTLLPHTFDVQALLSGAVDAMSVYVTDEPFALKQAGREYLLYSPRAVGIDFYGDNLFTTEDLLRREPELVRRFRDASLKGWDYAMQHTEEVARLIYDRYSQRHSLEHLRFEARQMESLLQTALIEVGHMNPGRWRNIAEVYAEMGMLRRDFDLKGFLYDPKPRDLTWLYGVVAGVALLLLIAVLAAVRFARLSQDRQHFLSLLIESGRADAQEYRFRKKGGAILIGLLSARLFTLNNERVLLGNITDITERKRIEEELARSKDAAEAANRAKSEFRPRSSLRPQRPPNASSGHPGLTESGLEALTTQGSPAAGPSDDQGLNSWPT